MSSVRFSDVWKYYGAIEAVRGLELSCTDGEMLALLGPSGCGKTTTLKMAAGIEAVSRGEILFDEMAVTRLAPGERNIAMVFEDYALYPLLTVFENIAFPLKVRHLGKAEIERRVGPVVDLLDLGPVRDDNVRSLSGGAQQRVSIGRALVREPQLVLFDEPLSHLDADQKVQLRTEIKRLQQTTGLTSILVTHDQTEAVAMADRVAVMNHGVLQQVASPDELYRAPANLFVAGFIGEPPMNLLPAEIDGDDGGVFLAGPGWRVDASGTLDRHLRGPGNGIVVGIRPEHVRVVGAAEHPVTARGRVFHCEPRGDSDVVVVEIETGRGSGPATLVTAETDSIGTFDAGDPVALDMPADRIIAFDAGTGCNLAAL